eukprot:TRINITY_DN101_c0_g1_i1.p1 TRINITY_DN101_c0_g1~~TRINITY_DN101_c0_g1_i1.p1  ORF type:complete len:291 (+),score=89.28 TRINITY_DN101_c0_g1_i1:114-875(+)
MVFFECQKCNETVKKPKLAKHLQFCGSGYVSCIDCCKVFAWNEWESHTTCMSEAQKYQGNLYQAKDNVNKGEQKQNAWVENVRKKMSDETMAAHIKANMEKLLGFDNIPRKQKPFGNFVKNSLKLWDERRIAELWEVIAAANAKPAAATPPAKEADKAAEKGAATPAKTEEAAATATAGTRKNGWGGWKRALDDELKEAGGELPWKRLRDALVAKHVESKGGEASEKLRDEALASIPDTYLSTKDEMVRMPSN